MTNALGTSFLKSRVFDVAKARQHPSALAAPCSNVPHSRQKKELAGARISLSAALEALLVIEGVPGGRRARAPGTDSSRAANGSQSEGSESPFTAVLRPHRTGRYHDAAALPRRGIPVQMYRYLILFLLRHKSLAFTFFQTVRKSGIVVQKILNFGS